MEIQHPLHQHPLKLVHVGSDGETVPYLDRACAGCDEELSGEVYACDSCGLYLHQSCANLPQRIEHFIHPGCPLFLKLVPKSEDGGEPQGMMLWYQCKTCNFGVDAACGHKPNSSEEDGLLRRFSHHHPLLLRPVDAEQSSKEDAKLNYCRGCDKLVSGNYYACEYDCGYYLHESCGGHLPRNIRHFFHQCTLSLTLVDITDCVACESDRRNVFLYHCQKCNFSMDVECIEFQPISPEDKGKRVQHWTHHHPLMLSERAEDMVRGRILRCHLCRREISGQNDYAVCEPCVLYFHKSCMDSPREIQHRCHPHPLWLSNRKRSFCNTCSTRSCFCYQCKKCMFNMDLKCALFSQEAAQGEHILHFCHHHPLGLFKDPKKDKTDMLTGRKLKCLVCKSFASGLTYGCKNCDVYLHKSCLDILPQTFRTAYGSLLLLIREDYICIKCKESLRGFHFRGVGSDQERWCIPCALEEALSFRVVSPSYGFSQLHFHPCSLTLKFFPTFTCNACFTHCHTHAYYCDQCDFYVGIKCAQMSMKGSSYGGEERKRHFCHWHPLQPSLDTEVSTASCNICGSHCARRPFYFCSDCDFHIHKSCLDILPQKIDEHYFNCSLVLLTSSSYRCTACQKENSSSLAFFSIQKGFKICTKCVIWPENKQNDDGATFSSIHHWHQLALVDKSEKDAANCLLCRSKVSTSTYYCSECKDYFHKACAEMPLVMQHHPLHRQHSLTLTSSHLLPESSRSCSLCQGDLLLIDSHHSGVYHCKECGFQLDKKCATSFPSIQYQGHPHLLTVVENMQGREVCNVCSASCINKMVFRCAGAECKFSIHLSCGPLPCNIKHSCHVHPLVLEDFYVEENYTDLFPCHVCEERRDPRLAVYRCAEGCPMLCEIKCVISEVMPKLLGAHGEVELRTTFPNVASKVISKAGGLIDITSNSGTASSGHIIGDSRGTLSTSVLEELQLSLIRDPNLHTALFFWRQKMLKSHGIELEGEDEDMFTFSKEAFGHFSSKFGCTTHLALQRGGIPGFISGHNGPAVEEEYVLPETLIPIYKECFCRNMAIKSAFGRSGRSENFKSLFVLLLCAVLHNMRITKLVDVTNERVLQWLTILKLVEQAEFGIGFICDKMKRVWDAHFLIKAKAIVDDKSARLDRRREELSRREEELLRELEDIRKEKEEVKKEEEKHHKYAGDGMRSLRKEYADTLLIKWKPAIAAVLDLEDQQCDPMESR